MVPAHNRLRSFVTVCPAKQESATANRIEYDLRAIISRPVIVFFCFWKGQVGMRVQAPIRD